LPGVGFAFFMAVSDRLMTVYFGGFFECAVKYTATYDGMSMNIVVLCWTINTL
jgi:hypothetical protein